jgi:hypothetical protein
MYQNGVLGATATAGTAGTAATVGILPFTGLNLVWFVIAAFALLMAAGALWRIAPRRQA